MVERILAGGLLAYRDLAIHSPTAPLSDVSELSDQVVRSAGTVE